MPYTVRARADGGAKTEVLTTVCMLYPCLVPVGCGVWAWPYSTRRLCTVPYCIDDPSASTLPTKSEPMILNLAMK